MRSRLFLSAALALFALPILAAERYVAITIDDLPTQRGNSLAEVQGITSRLIEQIRGAGTPVTAFVNEAKVHDGGEQELNARTALLEQWLDIGVELGNHTYSHADINSVGLDAYEQDLLRGEKILKQLLRTRGKTLTYFRHPYLHTGKDAQTKAALAAFLRDHNYVVAPVTIDNDEWIYGAAYDKAAEKKDEAAMRRIGTDYLAYMNQMFEFSEHVAQQVFGRDIKQTLLIHASALNAQYYGALTDMMKKRGYAFVSLSDALKDPAYRSEDKYVGPRGISWLFRWGQGKPLDDSKAPQIPSYIRELSGY